MAPILTPTTTPTPKSIHSLRTPSRTTPHTKHRLHFNSGKVTHQTDHPVEVIGRIRNFPDRKEKPISALHISSDRRSIQVRTEIGYRDFTLDGVSVSEEEDLDGFYKKFIKSRITGVKLGDKCTIMMYGPTGAGKSHTMFGCTKQPGLVYSALKDILGEVDEENEGDLGFGSFVQVTVLEIYNEEVYDLLSNSNGSGFSLGWHKGNASKVKLEVMGKKAKNATFLSGNEAGKISREVAKVEKRRIVKSTHCNDRSSRSHCMIILDVPAVGGRLMLVDMAGSENIEQAGQLGFEAKIQTAKINQGNTALKRVVESIANGDSHVPYRDSKLTMLLQDSFEDDKAKILMILCASPDPKELYKTISTLEYGAKAKCIVRGVQTPNTDNISCEDGSVAVILGSRIAAMDRFILKLQMENKSREKERNDAHEELMKKEEEVAALRTKLELMERMNPVESEEEINLKVKEREQILKLELEKKLEECQKMANEYVEMGRRRMKEKILQQQEELELLKRRLGELESELHHSKDYTGGDKSRKIEGGGFAKSLMGTIEVEDDGCLIAPQHTEKIPLSLSTVFEEEGQYKEKTEDEEVEKLVVEESTVHISRKVDGGGPSFNFNTNFFDVPQNLQTPKACFESLGKVDCCSLEKLEGKGLGLGLIDTLEDTKDPASARRTRIQNIFLLCGNHRELAQHVRTPTPYKKKAEAAEVSLSLSPAATPDENSIAKKSFSKENSPLQTARVPEFGHVRGVLSDVTKRNTIETPSTGLHVEPFASLKLLNDQNLTRSHLTSSRV